MDNTVGFLFGNGKENNFDIIRISASIIVIISHSFPLVGLPDPLLRIIGYASGGGLSVAVFFAISGFLVTRSIERNSLSSYVIARTLRIFPALLVVLLFDAFIIGPIFTTLPINEYFSDYLFGAHLRTFFLFSFNTALPGVFNNNPYPTWVNGSLWSLPYEFFLYLLLPLCFISGLLSKKLNWALCAMSVIGYFFAKSGLAGLNYTDQGTPIIGAIYPYLILEYGTFFVVGSSMWLYRDRIPLSFAGVFVLFALAWGGFSYRGGYLAYCLLVPYATLWCALALPKLIDLRKIGDLSYGIYIFAFPVQQSFVALHDGQISATHLTIITIPVVLTLAYASYWTIERPAMQVRNRVAQLPGTLFPRTYS